MCFGLVIGDLFSLSSSEDELSEVSSTTGADLFAEFFAPFLGEFLAPVFGELRTSVLGDFLVSAFGELLADPLVLPLSLEILRSPLELLREALRPFFCRVFIRTLSYTLSPSESEVANTKILHSFFLVLRWDELGGCRIESAFASTSFLSCDPFVAEFDHRSFGQLGVLRVSTLSVAAV